MSDTVELRGYSNELHRKIEEKTAIICVVGLGQVGLPTALSFLNLGYKVIGLDVNEKLIQNLESGSSSLPEIGISDLATKFLRNSSFKISIHRDVLSSAEVIIICVPTPLKSKRHSADMRFMDDALKSIVDHLGKLKLIIIESTLPPRTMKEYIIPMIERLSNKKAYVDFLISFCPERISPGNALHEFMENDRIIGANDEYSYRLTYSLFKNLTNGKIYRTDTTTAEIAKLAENSYRDINIAFANELAIICEKSNSDVMDVIRLANTHPRVNIHRPGPGVGGPCLPKDPYLLIMGNDFEKSIVKTARRINDSMPIHIVNILVRALRHSKLTKVKASVLLLGISYKPDVNDSRYSPSRDIVLGLQKEGFRNITVHDPFTEDSLGAKFNPDLNLGLSTADCVIVATGHTLYSSLSVKDFKKGCIIVDCVRLLNKHNFNNDRLIYITLGSQH
jgi:UDP-N-acetyl-D-mannosaminuronic acid dehydrogenase